MKITKNYHLENKINNAYNSLRYKKSRYEYVFNYIIAKQIYVDILYSLRKKGVMVLFNSKSVCLGGFFSESKPSYRKKPTQKYKVKTRLNKLSKRSSFLLV